MQCGLFQGAPRGDSSEQQGSPQGMVSSRGSLFQQQQKQQQQQQAALFQQASELLSIQTNFLQQTPPHQSPPHFHNPSPLSEPQDPQGALFHPQETSPTQEQVQAALFQSSLTVLSGSSLSPDQPPSAASLFLPQTSLPAQLATNGSQQQQQQQLAFLSAMQTSGQDSQVVFQSQSQLPSIQQGTPMEQQQPQSQPQSQAPQQGSLFQNISQHPSPNTLSPSPQQQAGLLFCSNPLSSHEQAPGLLFNSQGQMPPMSTSGLSSQESQQNPSMLFSQAGMVTVGGQGHSEPMALGNPTESRQQALFQEQPMQMVPSPNSGPEQPVGLFMPQGNMASMQGAMATQELQQGAMFSTQNGVAGLQTTTSSPVQQKGSLFQTAVTRNLSQPSQPQQSGLYLFGMQNDCNQLINGPTGPTLSDQIIAISQSGQSQRESDAQIQSLLNQSLSDSGTMQNSMTASQNMEKIDDLLVTLQEQGNNLTRSY